MISPSTEKAIDEKALKESQKKKKISFMESLPKLEKA
jgi:hypothetical protein